MSRFQVTALCLAVVSACALSACGKDEPKSTAPATQSAEAASATAPASKSIAASAATASEATTGADTSESEATFDVTTADYQKNFNRIMHQVGLDFRANLRLEKHADGIDIFQTILNDHLMVMVTVDKKSGKLTNVMMYGTGDGSSDSAVHLMSVAIAALTSAFPNGQTKVIGPEVVSLMGEYNDGDKNPATRIFNGVKLSHIRDKSVGAIFSASPI